MSDDISFSFRFASVVVFSICVASSLPNGKSLDYSAFVAG